MKNLYKVRVIDNTIYVEATDVAEAARIALDWGETVFGAVKDVNAIERLATRDELGLGEVWS